MAASPKEKFEAAVKVIQSLPKDASAAKAGAFQPSHGLMLKFYAYFKQANNGQCTTQRPAFWDVVGKAKWDAWSRLGDMSRDQAMLKYVDELKKVLTETYPHGYNRQEIVEAMPHTAMVQDFVQKLDNFYELVDPKDTSPQNSSAKLNGSVPNGSHNKTNGTESHSDDDLVSRSSEGQGERSDEQEVITASALRTHKFDGQGDVPEDDDIIQLNVTSQVTPQLVKHQRSFNAQNPLNGGVEFTIEPQQANETRDQPPSHSPNHTSLQDSDSEAEEFCDTSDSPQSQKQEVEDLDQTYMKSTDRVFDHTYHRPTSQPPTSHLPYNSSYSSQYGLRDWRRWQGKSSRGAGEGQPANTSQPQTTGAQQSSQQTVAGAWSQATGGRSQLLAAGRGGAGGGDGNDPPPHRPEVTQQIAMALVQLQQDMNSVLSRLNTLEALTVAQSQIRGRSRENSGSSQHSGSSWWWLTPRMRTWLVMLLWPFIVHWIIAFIARRRNRRR